MLPAWIQHLSLAWPLAKRDVMARYRGSVLGLAWAILVPLAMVAVYAWVFEGVFKSRWGVAGAAGAEGGGFGYAARVFAGLIVFGAVSEVVNRATRLMADNANLVKRVVFPLELLAVALLMQVGLHALLQVGVLAALLCLLGEGPRASWALLPLAFVWVVLLQFTLALLLSALGTYVRDLQHVVPVAMTALMFMTPLFFPASAAPPALALLLTLNPLSAPMELTRTAWFAQPLDLSLTLWQLLALLLALPLALWLFKRLRPGFADLV